MLAKVMSGAVCGVEAYPVEIEVNAGKTNTGLPQENAENAKTEIKTIHELCDAVREVAYAVHVYLLAAKEDSLDPAVLAQYALIGELALSGEVRKVKGVLPMAIRLKKEGIKGVLDG